MTSVSPDDVNLLTRPTDGVYSRGLIVALIDGSLNALQVSCALSVPILTA